MKNIPNLVWSENELLIPKEKATNEIFLKENKKKKEIKLEFSGFVEKKKEVKLEFSGIFKKDKRKLKEV